jgi:hypothetical protein
VINYIKTPQQLELFGKFQNLANADLRADQPEILAPVKPVVTRWNSYYSAFERAVTVASDCSFTLGGRNIQWSQSTSKDLTYVSSIFAQ